MASKNSDLRFQLEYLMVILNLALLNWFTNFYE
jgi:hypothetical protein